jgi:hypothetical protein
MQTRTDETYRERLEQLQAQLAQKLGAKPASDGGENATKDEPQKAPTKPSNKRRRKSR